MAESPGAFARVLRQLRTGAHLTQEELAEASGVSLRSVSDLERGTVTTPQKDTMRPLADALHLTGPVRAQFEAVARGRPVPGGLAAAATRALPRDVVSFTGRQRELSELVEAAAGAGGVVSIHTIGGMAGVGKTEALAIYSDLGTQAGQANALLHLGAIRRAAGDYPAAARDLREALASYREVRHRGGEVTAINETGTLHRVSGDVHEAEACHRQALELAREIGGAWDEAHALAGLGRCALAVGDAARAGSLLRQALEIFQRIGAAEAAGVAAELDALPGGAGGAAGDG